MALFTQQQYLKIGILLHYSLKQERKTEIKRLLFCFEFSDICIIYVASDKWSLKLCRIKKEKKPARFQVVTLFPLFILSV